MTHPIFVEILHSIKNLREELGSSDIIDPLVPDNVIEKLSRVDVLHDQVQLTLRLYDLVQLHYARVPDLFQNFDFSSYPVNVHLVLDLAFFENFNGHFFLRNCLNSELHFAECALAQRLVDQEVGDLAKLLGLVGTGLGILGNGAGP